MKRILGKPHETNNKLISLIQRVKINNFYLKNKKDFRDQILSDIDSKDDVLDIGMAMRDKHQKIISNSLETLDVNDYGSYPNIVCDICSDLTALETKLEEKKFEQTIHLVYSKFESIIHYAYIYDKESILFVYNKINELENKN